MTAISVKLLQNVAGVFVSSRIVQTRAGYVITEIASVVLV
jgi:hypothetical protein